MRELHVVALSEDGRSVLLAASADAGRPTHRVALDSRLVAAVRGDLPRPGEGAPRESSVSPKEIQARLRAGETPEQIAKAAGVPVARVERFSGPVVSERARVIDAARAAVLVRGRRGPSVLPLGEAVDLALTQTPSLREGSVDWSARRVDDGAWVVTVAWHARARNRSASWRWDPLRKELTAVDAASAALGHVDADAAERPPARRAAARPATRRAADEAATGSARTGSRGAAKPAGKPGARKAASGKAAAKRTTSKRAATGAEPTPTAAKRGAATAVPSRGGAKARAAEPARKPAAAKPAAAKPVAKRAAKPAAKPAARPAAGLAAKPAARPATGLVAKPAARPAAEPAAGPATKPAVKAARSGAAAKRTTRGGAGTPLRVVPPPQDAAEPAQQDEQTTSRPRQPGRASVPGWADVLLSTAPRERD